MGRVSGRYMIFAYWATCNIGGGRGLRRVLKWYAELRTILASVERDSHYNGVEGQHGGCGPGWKRKMEGGRMQTVKYDYERQCWVEVDPASGQGRVLPCEHPAEMHPRCCYAGAHAGETIPAEAAG